LNVGNLTTGALNAMDSRLRGNDGGGRECREESEDVGGEREDGAVTLALRSG